MQRFGSDDFRIGHAGNRRGIKAVHLRDADKAVAFGDEHFAVGHDGERPWSVEARDDRLDFERRGRFRRGWGVGLAGEGGLWRGIVLGFGLRARGGRDQRDQCNHHRQIRRSLCDSPRLHSWPLGQFVWESRGEMLHAFGCGGNYATRWITASRENEEFFEIESV